MTDLWLADVRFPNGMVERVETLGTRAEADKAARAVMKERDGGEVVAVEKGKMFDVELEGPEVVWAHRDHPDYWAEEPERDLRGEPVPGTGKRREVKRAAYCVVTLPALDAEEAKFLALARERGAGYRKVLRVSERKV
jgi:hypothetical protein